VLQSDELARNADPSVRNGENDPPKEGISNEEPQEDGRRQQQNESQPALILQKPPAWWRLGGHRVGSEYRHISISYEYVLTVIASPSKMGRSEPQCGAARGTRQCSITTRRFSSARRGSASRCLPRLRL